MRKISIVQGEHAVTGEPDTMISTLLGSCVAVCLHDSVAKLGGMNHFLLGEPGADQKLGQAEMQRYGIHAMEVLINAMMQKGAVRHRLRAHLYGGGNIVSGLGAIGSNNAAFARRFMEMEGIAIGHCDLGGTSARKVDFIPYEGRTRCVHVSERIVPAPKPAPKTVPAGGGELELF